MTPASWKAGAPSATAISRATTAVAGGVDSARSPRCLTRHRSPESDRSLSSAAVGCARPRRVSLSRVQPTRGPENLTKKQNPNETRSQRDGRPARGTRCVSVCLSTSVCVGVCCTRFVIAVLRISDVPKWQTK